MSKIRMNTEFRNKILNRYVESAEKEITQEQQAFLGQREKVDELEEMADENGKIKKENMNMSKEEMKANILKNIEIERKQ